MSVKMMSTVIEFEVARPRTAPAPAVASRLQARAPPCRGPRPVEAAARKELVIASEKSRKATIAAAHNARVTTRAAETAELRAQSKDYLQSTIASRLQKGEALRLKNLGDIKAKAHKDVARVAEVAEKNENRKVQLANQLDRSLEHAEEKRTKKIKQIQFKAANVVQRHKAVLATSAKEASARAQSILESLDLAATKRDNIIQQRVAKAAAVSKRAALVTERTRLTEAREAAELAYRIEEKLREADITRSLTVQLRKTKAEFVNEHHANVVQSQRLTDAVSPLVAHATLAAQLQAASQRRSNTVEGIRERAANHLRKAEQVVADRLAADTARMEAAKKALEDRMAAARARKWELTMSGRGSPVRPASAPVSPQRREAAVGC